MLYAILLALLCSLVHAETIIKCGTFNRSNAFLLPVREAVSSFLNHPGCNNTQFDGNSVSVAAWPQYANISDNNDSANLHVAGYGYASSPCLAKNESRRATMRRVFGLTGGNISHYDPKAMLPVEYAAWHVAGAKIELRTGETAHFQINGNTNEYGVFNNFLEISLPPQSYDGRISTTTSQLSIRDCGYVDALEWKNIASPMKTFLIPPTGLTVVSDIDDTLRVAEIWNPMRAILGTFTRPFEPWMHMPDIYKSWQTADPETHFHYLSDSPEVSHQIYIDGVEEHYPAGTWDFRPMIYDSWESIFNPRYRSLKQLVETFPKRKFILVGDTATGSTISAYEQIAREHTSEIQCILIRDVTATEPANWIVPSLKTLRKHHEGKYLMFRTPRDLESGNRIKSRMELIREAMDKNVTGCGVDTVWRNVRDGVDTYGAVASWTWTLWTGFSYSYRCFILMHRRPHRACPFDMRNGTWFWHGGYAK